MTDLGDIKMRTFQSPSRLPHQRTSAHRTVWRTLFASPVIDHLVESRISIPRRGRTHEGQTRDIYLRRPAKIFRGSSSHMHLLRCLFPMAWNSQNRPISSRWQAPGSDSTSLQWRRHLSGYERLAEHRPPPAAPEVHLLVLQSPRTSNRLKKHHRGPREGHH